MSWLHVVEILMVIHEISFTCAILLDHLYCVDLVHEICGCILPCFARVWQNSLTSLYDFASHLTSFTPILALLILSFAFL
mgnify:FL=1